MRKEKLLVYSCCNSKQSEDIAKRKRRLYLKMPKEISCDVGPRTFASRISLSHHKKTHSGVKTIKLLKYYRYFGVHGTFLKSLLMVTCKAAGFSEITSAACLRARLALCSPSAAITLL